MTLITGSWDPGGQSKQTNSYFEARHRFLGSAGIRGLLDIMIGRKFSTEENISFSKKVPFSRKHLSSQNPVFNLSAPHIGLLLLLLFIFWG